MPLRLTIKWGKEKLFLDVADTNVPLLQLRQSISEWSHLPIDGFKLIHAGAVMKDDNAPLSVYRFRPNTTIQVVGSVQSHSSASNSGGTEKSEQSTISQIRDHLAQVRSELVPSLQSFLQTLPTAANPNPPFPLPVDTTSTSTRNLSPLDKEHARLGELLLQSLLKLDAITADGDWEEARKERKAGVKEVQGYLDQLDESWRTRVR